METRAAYRAKFEAQLEQAQARLEQMQATVKERMADAAIAMGSQINELEQDVAEARGRLGEIGQVHDDKWEDFKASMKGAWEKAAARFAKIDRPAGDPTPVPPTYDPAPPARSPEDAKGTHNPLERTG
ncbi:hypothetical protein [uncultured Piscinibacter sp.]|uniref:hypothetical protein n=1 Tax=uncultured Piscinibacter sp. TaxID=1131835 RepID=UPI002625128A|nr:hypothetical protein [uncultured Piscinibacter sp.]